jgi:hypothetical protein
MNATGDSEENPELLTSGAPLSAPVAGGMLQTREPSMYFREPDDSPRPYGGADRPPVPVQPAGLPRRPAAHAPAAATPPGAEPPAAEPPWEEHPAAEPPWAESPAAEPHPDLAAAAEPRAAEPRAAEPPAPPAPVARPGERYSAPRPPARAASVLADWSADDPPEDPNRVLIRKHLDAVRVSAASASSWLETSVHYARLLNRDGVVPVNARFTREDIEFLGRAREQVLGFAELGLRLVELHAPLDAGGISTDPSSPILRCRSCMWRWPCPTFRMLADALSHLPGPGSPPAR